MDIDVSQDPRQAFINRRSPYHAKGTELTVHIPFTGEATFFNVRPSTFSLSPPRGVVQNGELLLRFQYPNDSPPPNLKFELEGQVRQISGYLQSLKESAERLRIELRSIAGAAWQRRKSQFVLKTEVIGSLGLPKREFASAKIAEAVKPRADGPLLRAAKDHSEPKISSWHLFISHASEDKTAIAKPLADALIAAGFSVWYDDYTLTVGDSLRQKIDEGLAKSDFGIVILSSSFFAKHWPQQELNGLASREINGKKVILPVWHDISRDEVTAASPILADRLGVPTSLGLDHVVRSLIRAMK